MENKDAARTKRTHTPLYEIELKRRGSVVSEATKIVTGASEAVKLFDQFIGDAPNENFVMACLDARKRVIGISKVSVGTLSASLVHPREVFRAAILLNAAAIIVCHNHPSGDANPSPEDRDVTRRLVRAGELLGIPVVDHIIIAREPETGGVTFKSFREIGIL